MCSLINKQLLLTAYAYLYITEQQKGQRGSEALQLQSNATAETVEHQRLVKWLWSTKVPNRANFAEILKFMDPAAVRTMLAMSQPDGKNWIPKFVDNHFLFGEHRDSSIRSETPKIFGSNYHLLTIPNKFAEIVAAAIEKSVVDVAKNVNLGEKEIVDKIVKNIVVPYNWTGVLKEEFEGALRAGIAEVAVALTEVRQMGGALQGLDQKMKNNQLVCMAAAQCDGWSLEYAGDDMKKDSQVCMVAAQQNGRAALVVLANAGIEPDQELVIAAVTNNTSALSCAGAMKSDVKVVMAAVRNSFWAFEHAGHDLKEDKKAVMDVVKIDGRALRFARTYMKNDEDVVKAALTKWIPAGGVEGHVLAYAFVGDESRPDAIEPNAETMTATQKEKLAKIRVWLKAEQEKKAKENEQKKKAYDEQKKKEAEQKEKKAKQNGKEA